VLLQAMPQALLAQSGVAFATLVAHGAAGVETKRHPFESALHVSMSLALVQTWPACVHVGSLLQTQLASPAVPEQTSCVAHVVVVCTRHPFASGTQVTRVDEALQEGLVVAHSGSVMHAHAADPAVPLQILSGVQVVGVPLMKKQPFASVAHVTSVVLFSHARPTCVQVASMAQAQLASPAAPVQTSCTEHGAAAVETKRHPLESALHVSMSPAMVHAEPGVVHVGSLLHVQAGPPSLSTLHVWCVPQTVGFPQPAQPLAVVTHVATPFDMHSVAPSTHAFVQASEASAASLPPSVPPLLPLLDPLLLPELLPPEPLPDELLPELLPELPLPYAFTAWYAFTRRHMPW
jgi:hypothetical protein